MSDRNGISCGLSFLAKFIIRRYRYSRRALNVCFAPWSNLKKTASSKKPRPYKEREQSSRSRFVRNPDLKTPPEGGRGCSTPLYKSQPKSCLTNIHTERKRETDTERMQAQRRKRESVVNACSFMRSGRQLFSPVFRVRWVIGPAGWNDEWERARVAHTSVHSVQFRFIIIICGSCTKNNVLPDTWLGYFETARLRSLNTSLCR